jgi:hypothetical protein
MIAEIAAPPVPEMRPRRAGPLRHAGRVGVLQLKNKAQTLVKLLKLRRREAPDTFGKERFIDRDELRNVDHRIARKTATLFPQKEITGRKGKSGIGRYDSTNNGLDSTLSKVVGLNDYQRTAVTRFGSSGLAKRCPPNFSATHHHFSR